MDPDLAKRTLRRLRDAAVITGGDRPEIQTATLDAAGVRSLILTGGHEPPGSVLGRAEQAGVAVLLVDSDTITTVERAEAVVRAGRMRDEWSVDRMRSFVGDHGDVPSILDFPSEVLW